MWMRAFGGNLINVLFFCQERRGRPGPLDVSNLLRVGIGGFGVPFFILWFLVDSIPKDRVLTVGNRTQPHCRVGALRAHGSFCPEKVHRQRAHRLMSSLLDGFGRVARFLAYVDDVLVVRDGVCGGGPRFGFHVDLLNDLDPICLSDGGHAGVLAGIDSKRSCDLANRGVIDLSW